MEDVEGTPIRRRLLVVAMVGLPFLWLSEIYQFVMNKDSVFREGEKKYFEEYVVFR